MPRVRARFTWDDGSWHEGDVALDAGATPASIVEFHRSCSGRIPSVTVWSRRDEALPTCEYDLVYDGPTALRLPEFPDLHGDSGDLGGGADRQLPRDAYALAG